jgi:ppGpp synthetase/RelA/SpoT-type nucleotidyltranferase
MKTAKKKQCGATTRAGSRCKRRAILNSEFCSVHAENTDRKALRLEYDSLFPIASRFSQAIEDQLETLISSQSLTLGVPIERRVKRWTSIAEKLDRNKLQLDSVRQLDDLVGLRLILLFQRDLEGDACSSIE